MRVSQLDGISAATQNTGLRYSLLYDRIVLSCCLLYFTLMFFFVLFAVNFVIFSLQATILLNMNLNLKTGHFGYVFLSKSLGSVLKKLDLTQKTNNAGKNTQKANVRVFDVLYIGVNLEFETNEWMKRKEFQVDGTAIWTRAEIKKHSNANNVQIGGRQ